MSKLSAWMAFRKVVRKTETRTSALLRVGEAVTNGSWAMTEAFRSELSHEMEEKKKHKWVDVLFELQYFLLFLVSYEALQIAGEEKRGRLCDDLAPLVIDSTIQAVFGHWPEDYRQRIRKEYFENLAQGEFEYGSCKSILSRGDATDLNDVALWRCAKTLARLKGHENNLGAIVGEEAVLTIWLKKANFARLVQDAVGTY